MTTQYAYDVPLLRGFLTRQETSGTKGWNKKWFQNSYATPTVLDCYSNEKATKPSSSIDFKEVTDLKVVRTKSEDSDKKRYGFQFKYGKHTQKLLAEGEEEGQYWREGFSALIKLAQGKAPEKKVKAKAKDNKTDEDGLYEGEYFVQSVIDFRSSDPGVLSFRKSEYMILLGTSSSGWSPVEFGGKRGWVPTEFIARVDQTKNVN
ncbi:hypothetical protein EIN_224500 [Entamoeba invadens IP1]|uniref:SH3 domain-containing protein n=1 Tax=Entamoeba invadens IP1 TaxID=370355 RepID=A0A0A1U2C1_ENTIV|nr:hypothetical protein EIN_224500 [Entamoeba invadens IP1]ELP88207.1 hypothetical protein EIN_224500 [Entamoeba invadens IP1]|eukprot:XP_004254978.1 hypothetical protein EIN_224500 [Entamoeba invadens IP1]